MAAVYGAAGCCEAPVLAGRRGEGGQAGAQEPVMQAGEEQGAGDAVVGDLVAEGAGDALDEAVHPQAPQVVGHLPRGDGLGGNAGELRHDRAQIAVGEAAGKKPEDAQRREQGMGAGVAEADGRDAGPGLGDEGLADLGDRVLAVGGVVADLLVLPVTEDSDEGGAEDSDVGVR
jgi:hypothetical protein